MAGDDETDAKDVQAVDLLDALGELAVAVRERDPRQIRLATNAVLALGDPRACLVVASAMIPINTAVDPWWLNGTELDRHEGDLNRARLAAALGVEDDYRWPA